MSKVDIQVTREFVLIDPPQTAAVDSKSGDNITINNDCNTAEVSNTIQNVDVNDPSNTVVITESELQTVQVNNSASASVINTNDISMIAGEDLGGQKWVTADSAGDAILADSDTILDANLIIGMTRTSVTDGQAVFIRTFGELTDVSFSFTPDECIWLGKDGLSTQTPPSDGINVLVGQAITATRILIRIQQTITKAS